MSGCRFRRETKGDIDLEEITPIPERLPPKIQRDKGITRNFLTLDQAVKAVDRPQDWFLTREEQVANARILEALENIGKCKEVPTRAAMSIRNVCSDALRHMRRDKRAEECIPWGTRTDE
jgi:hypothetical protein